MLLKLSYLASRATFSRLSERFRRDRSGSSAVEFAIVATPFLMFIFGLIAIALYFFIMNSVERGMDQTSRLIRTGQAQATLMTVNQFKQSICDKAGGWVKCNKLQMFVSRYPDWASVNPSPCVDSSGAVIVNSAPGSSLIALYAGTASDIVIVTACYKWELPQKFPYIDLGNMSDGSMMLQTATAFRSEPYLVN